MIIILLLWVHIIDVSRNFTDLLSRQIQAYLHVHDVCTFPTPWEAFILAGTHLTPG